MTTKTPAEKRISSIRKLHRRLGLVLVVFLILLAGSGILLNHTEDLKLSSQPIYEFIGAVLYDLDNGAEVKAWQVDDQWLYTRNDRLFLNGLDVGYCEGALLGAVEFRQQRVALCSGELLIIESEGQLVERIAIAGNGAADVTALGRSGAGLVLLFNDSLRLFDPDRLEYAAFTKEKQVQWNSAQPLPAYLSDQLQNSVPEINLERLVLDIHSGRILGKWRQMAMDLLALLILVLAVGGFVMSRVHRG